MLSVVNRLKITLPSGDQSGDSSTSSVTIGRHPHERSDTSGLNVDPVQALAIHERTCVVSFLRGYENEAPIGRPPRFKPMGAMPEQLVEPKPTFFPGSGGTNSEDKRLGLEPTP